MPELPEVETIVRTLRPQVVGRVIQGVQRRGPPLRQPWKSQWDRLVATSQISEIHRRGKWILLELSRPYHRLVVHLGMTGRLLVQPGNVPRLKHTHFVFPLDSGDHLRYVDPRRFGVVLLARTQGAVRFAAETGLGPEPFDLTTKHLHADFCRSRRCLKALLLDQGRIAGVGNIYADEALYDARLHPRLLGERLSLAQAERLRCSIVKVLSRAIETKGSTISDFYFGDNQPGSFQHEFKVYEQTGKPCSRCKSPIKRIRLAGRSTHFCSQCQRT